ncbi:MAG: ImmA/IrrE family metallo-endopeptidase [Thermomicrobiales bacterium]|nr:ImmA/IrrE family metallo-endopeptidase [Thermomicrobiales bacterium]
MTTYVPASIPVLTWAAERSGLADEQLLSRFSKWQKWLDGEANPTMRQLETFASLTHTPIGYFFLPEPPEISLPVPDFRTFRDSDIAEPSANLLDTIYLCQQRQEWYKEYARIQAYDPLTFVGKATADDDPEAVAADIRDVLGLSIEERQRLSTWADALRQLIRKIEDAGVMVMISSVVGSNSHRKLNLEEFRGFALSDDYAPLIFLNGADSKSAQMFSLVHELAHVWLGQSGVSDTTTGSVPRLQVEKWCNQVAAEVLVPMASLRDSYNTRNDLTLEIQRLARLFKVSSLVILRRIHDAGYIDTDTLWSTYHAEVERIHALDERAGGGGGDFYRSLGARVSSLFARAVLSSTLEGQTSFTDAFRMLGVRKATTFYEAARQLGVAQ